jgi:hypothetical protein
VAGIRNPNQCEGRQLVALAAFIPCIKKVEVLHPNQDKPPAQLQSLTRQPVGRAGTKGKAGVSYEKLFSALSLSLLALAQTGAAETTVDSQIIERGQDHAVIRVITAKTTQDQETRYRTNQFTLLENAMHYFEAVEWKESENLIEPFPEGAIARRGPNKAIFSPDLNDEAVFDILASDGNRIREAFAPFNSLTLLPARPGSSGR